MIRTTHETHNNQTPNKALLNQVFLDGASINNRQVNQEKLSKECLKQLISAQPKQQTLSHNTRPQTPEQKTLPLNKSEDQYLLEAFHKGDKSAFNLIVKKYDRKIRNMVSRIIFQKEDVEDIMQEAWLSIFNGLGRFRGDAQLYSWLYRIAQNTAISAVKKEIRKKKTFEAQSTDQSEDQHAFNENSPLNLTNQEYTPEEVLLNEQLTHHFEKGLALLSNEVRETFIYREHQGMSYQDIATIQEIPIGTVRSRIARARDVITNQSGLQDINLQPA